MPARSCIIHFSKPGFSRGHPWTVHFAGQCIPAREVVIEVPTETVFKPEKKQQPRAWIKARGYVSVSDDGTVVVRARP